ncbi:MAG: hypothetical protein HQM13_18490 [SAR324 cluster bacterium]|nr:hypothetical protein [SAR324 cluster bacterium]
MFNFEGVKVLQAIKAARIEKSSRNFPFIHIREFQLSIKTKHLFLIGMLSIGLIFLNSCGRRTPPRPNIVKTSFQHLKVIQRGEQLRLFWEMKKAIPETGNSEQFKIEELQVEPDCTNCIPQLSKVYIAPFPSEHFIISGKQVFFYPAIRKDLKFYLYKVMHQSEDGENFNNPQVANFRGFVDFPEMPPLQWHWLPKSSLPELPKFPVAALPSSVKNFRLLRFSWKPQQEKIEFYFPNRDEVVQRKLFYRVNLYKKNQGDAWPETPINRKPIAENFFIDYQVPGEKAFLYQMRWVDSRGNESGASSTYVISLKPNP